MNEHMLIEVALIGAGVVLLSYYTLRAFGTVRRRWWRAGR